jgi:hypothetical protein
MKYIQFLILFILAFFALKGESKELSRGQKVCRRHIIEHDYYLSEGMFERWDVPYIVEYLKDLKAQIEDYKEEPGCKEFYENLSFAINPVLNGRTEKQASDDYSELYLKAFGILISSKIQKGSY